MDKNGALVRLAESTRTDFGKVDFDRQSAPQRVFSSIWELEAQVNNGGFDAYLRYADPDSIAYASLALKEIGALRCAVILEQVLELVGPLASTRDGPEDTLDALGADEALNALGQEFLAYPDDLTELLFAFVQRHPQAFGPVSLES